MVEGSANGARHVATALAELQELQVCIDSIVWQIDSPPSAYVRHTMLHLAKVLGRLAGFCEESEHFDARAVALTNSALKELTAKHAVDEIVGELLAGAARIARSLDIDIDLAYLNRQRQGLKRFAPDSPILREITESVDGLERERAETDSSHLQH